MSGRDDGELALWRQGDCTVGDLGFIVRFDPRRPLCDESREVAAEVDVVDMAVRGLVVVTQTCDIVRDLIEKPFVEVSPLIEVDEAMLSEVAKGRRPRFALVPALAETRLVCDLDRTMTLEKPVVASWQRIAGCKDDQQARNFAQALARKRERFAFPDDFTHFARKLRSRLQEKHDKDTPEGRALRALREIRVRAAPSWSATSVDLTFWFVREDDEEQFEGQPWNEHLEKWLKLLKKSGRYLEFAGWVVSLDDLTARDFVESDRLDLDYLSQRPGKSRSA